MAGRQGVRRLDRRREHGRRCTAGGNYRCGSNRPDFDSPGSFASWWVFICRRLSSLVLLFLLLHLPGPLLAAPLPSGGSHSSSLGATAIGVDNYYVGNIYVGDDAHEALSHGQRRREDSSGRLSSSADQSHSLPSSSRRESKQQAAEREEITTWRTLGATGVEDDDGGHEESRELVMGRRHGRKQLSSDGSTMAAVGGSATVAAAAAGNGCEEIGGGSDGCSRTSLWKWLSGLSGDEGLREGWLLEEEEEEKEEKSGRPLPPPPHQSDDRSNETEHTVIGSVVVGSRQVIITRQLAGAGAAGGGGGGGGWWLRIRPITGNRGAVVSLSNQNYAYGLAHGVCIVNFRTGSRKGGHGRLFGNGGEEEEETATSLRDVRVEEEVSQEERGEGGGGGMKMALAARRSEDFLVVGSSSSSSSSSLSRDVVDYDYYRYRSESKSNRSQSGTRKSQPIEVRRGIVNEFALRSPRLIIASFLAVIGGALANAGGVGGGGLFVPLFNLLLEFDAKTSVALSKSMIFGGAIVSYAYNIKHRHPSPNKKHRPLIDYDVALLLQPMLLLGISIGVLCNVVFPSWMVVLLLTVLLSYVSFRSSRSGCRMWKKESLMAMEAAMETKVEHAKQANNEEEDDNDKKKAEKMNKDCRRHDQQQRCQNLERHNEEKEDENQRVRHSHDHHKKKKTKDQDDVQQEERGRGEYCDACYRHYVDDGHRTPPQWEEEEEGEEEERREKDCFLCNHNDDDIESGCFGNGNVSAGTVKHKSAMVDPQLTEKLIPSPPPLLPPLTYRLPVCCCGKATMMKNGTNGEQKTTEEEERKLELPWKKLGILFLVWTLFFLVQVAKSGKICVDGNSTVRSCGVAYWILNVSQIPMAFLFTGWAIRTLFISHGGEQQQGECPSGLSGKQPRVCGASQAMEESEQEGREDGDPVLGPRELFLFPFLSLVAGTMGGLLGLGGGMVICPLLLELGFDPQVTSATGVFMVLFSSSMSVAEYALLGRIPYAYAIYFSTICAFASWLGHVAIAKIIKQWGRVSVIIFATSLVILFSVIVMGVFGSLEVLVLYREGAYMGFNDICSVV